MYLPRAGDFLMEDGVVETCDNSIQGNKKRDMRTLLVLVFSPIFFLATLLYARENLAATEEKARPSLLLITIDTLRADRLPFYGYNRDTAPFLGKLAEQGIVFTNAYSTSSWTVPSVTSMITGVYPHSHGVVRGTIKKGQICEQRIVPRELQNLPAQLRALGYRTYAVTANSHLMKELGFGRGFDRYLCVGFRDAEKVNQAFLRWMDEIKSHKGPVFIWLHYFDPHIPYRGKQPWLRQYQPDETDKEFALINSAVRPERLRQIIEKNGQRFLDLAQAHYDSEVNYCDAQIKNLFQEFPLLERFTVVFTADHGDEFMEHKELGHSNNLYNETVRIPLFVRFPERKQTTRSDEVVSLVDVAPTLLSLAGGNAPPSWQGRAFFDQKGNTVSLNNRSVLAHLHHDVDLPLNALIGRDWKIITNDKTKASELYNLKNDPKERSNLAQSQSEKTKQQSAMLQHLISALPPAPAEGEKKKIQKEKAEMLQSLGYVQ